MAKFFIDRPVFAWVLALALMIAGAISLTRLPIAQYPPIAPPSVVVSVSYPGATATKVDASVISLIEQEMNGADNLQYMESQSQADGQGQMTLYFLPGTNPDLAAVDVQNRLKRVEPRLPQAVTQQGISVQKSTGSFLQVITLSSTDGKLKPVALGDYLARNVINEIKRVPGVGDTQLFGSEHALRIWIDPDKLRGLNLTPKDIVEAIQTQNVQISGGIIGDLPNDGAQAINASVTVGSELDSPEGFGNIILKDQQGGVLRLKDVARIELGGQTYGSSARLDGKPTSALGIQLSPNANALATANAVRARMDQLSRYFPPNVQYAVPYDTSRFVKISIEDLVRTLFEAIVLVFLVIYLFLQNIRYTLIPTIVVPVALLSTFAVMLTLGFSINVLTMFGMVLAIGILVDDAIVVVENVERIMREEGLSPREATRKAMGQITGAIIGITLVLTAVFIPMAFFGGAVGAIYRQFSLSMVSSIFFSALMALTLTPALCGTLLKPIEAGAHGAQKGFFGWFNRGFERQTRKYENMVTRILRRTGRYMVIYIAIILGVGLLFVRLPSSFLPVEDQGYLITNVQLPPGAAATRTSKVLSEVEHYFMKQPAVQHVISVLGFSFSGRGQNAGLVFVPLKDWSVRSADEAAAIVARQAFRAFSTIRDAVVYPLNPPPIPELGNATGFTFRLQDRGGVGHTTLLNARNQLLGLAAQSAVLRGVRPEGLDDTSQVYLDIDRDKAGGLGIDFGDLAQTLSTAMGSTYADDFTNFGRLQRIIVQSDAPYRMKSEDLLKLQVRNANGVMVPFSAFASTRWITAPVQLVRYNGYPSFKISGDAAPGRSTGEAMAEMERLAAQLPAGIGYEWTGQSLEEITSGSQAPALFALALLAVFLCLAALYESWSIPFSVMLVVPLGVIGALLAATLRGLPDDVYFKVGLIAIIGLSAKNAILIVEFAKDLQKEGKSLLDATIEAAHLRFRPILMTSFAFILGVVPLVIARGAGSASQKAIGTGVMGGMMSATVLAIFFVPVFFVVVRRSLGSRSQDKVRREDA